MKPSFTLVELLVVVAVIAVLASLLLPSLALSKLKAREVACLSSKRQCMAAFNMYAGDFQGKTSPANQATSQVPAWRLALPLCGYLPMSFIISYNYIPASGDFNMKVRYPNVESCPSFLPAPNPARPNEFSHTAFGVRAWWSPANSPAEKWDSDG